MSKIKLNKKYKSLFTSNSRFFICTGGRGSAKSFSVSYWSALMLLFETGHTVLFSRYTMTSAHISIIPEFVSKIELMGQIDNFEVTKDSIICKTTGSKMIFRGIKSSSGDQTANLKSLAGVTTWILDEAEELLDESIFDTIQLSVRNNNRQNRIILIMNPASKVHWIYKRFFEGEGIPPGTNDIIGDTTYIHTTYKDNEKNLPKSFINDIEKIAIKNPAKFNHLILGGWLDVAEGVIFSNWEFGEFDTDLEYGYGLDFGYSPDPTAMAKIAIDKDKKIIYLHEEIYQTEMLVSDLITSIKPITQNKVVIADNSANRLITELSREGVNVLPCVKGAGSIEEGIKLMMDYKIIITPSSTNLVKEMNNYIWSNKKAGAPIDMYNHIIDGIRYYCSHILKVGNSPLISF